MHSWIHPALSHRKHPILNDGVFADASIAKGERLVVFGGYVMTFDEEEQLPEPIQDYAHQIDDDLVLGIKRVEDIQPSDYINHSCEPNAGFNGQIFLVAMRDIEKDEEIAFDYAMTLAEAENVEPYVMECKCGNVACRKTIRDTDWRDPDLQKKYRGYFQYYIQRRIDSLANDL